jgi:hypothetical protein
MKVIVGTENAIFIFALYKKYEVFICIFSVLTSVVY